MKRQPRTNCGRVAAGLLIALMLLIPARVGLAQATAEEVLGAIVSVVAQVPAEARTAETLGTEREGHGVVIDSSGLVVTIGYLILEATAAEVKLQDGRVMPAQVVGYDHETGFGLLRMIEAPKIKPVRLGESRELKVGDPVIVAAHADAGGVARAVVTSRREFAGYWEYLLENAIFTQPPLPNFGGAALIDRNGRLVGIGSLLLRQTDPGEEVSPGNMFVPIDELKPILAELLTEGLRRPPRRPWIGIYTEEVRGRVTVTRLARGAPSDAADIAPGDIIVAVGGSPVTGQGDFYRRLWAAGPAGTPIELTVLTRDAGVVERTVRSIDRYSWLRIDRGN